MSDVASSTARKFETAPAQTVHATIEEVEQLARVLAARISDEYPRTDLVVGIANGAFLPAQGVAGRLGVPFFMVKVRRRGSRYKQRLAKVAEVLRIPPGLILWGPLRAMWVFFQDLTNDLESAGEPLGFDVAGKHVALVDDVVDTGGTLRHVTELLLSAGAAEVRTAVYCWSIMPKVPEDVSRPDIHLHRQVQFYPWSGNSIRKQDYLAWLSRNEIEAWD